LGSVVSTTSGTDRDVEATLGKARSTFRAMDRLYIEVQNNWKNNKDKDV